jgi:hypothetical protein
MGLYMKKGILYLLFFLLLVLSTALPLLADEEGEKESNSEALFALDNGNSMPEGRFASEEISLRIKILQISLSPQGIMNPIFLKEHACKPLGKIVP